MLGSLLRPLAWKWSRPYSYSLKCHAVQSVQLSMLVKQRPNLIHYMKTISATFM